MPARIKKDLSLFVKAFNRLRRNEPLILSSSTAFFTTFSISPILIILVNLLSFYFSNRLVTEELFGTIRNSFGREAATEIRNIVTNLRAHDGSWTLTIGSLLFFTFIATTLFNIIKHAISAIWKIRRKTVHHLKYNFVERAKAVALIISIGLLFIVSLMLDTTTSFMHDYLDAWLPEFHMKIINTLNIMFSLVVVTAWFSFLFKFLPDAMIKWKVALVGGLVTAMLFTFGKWILGNLLLYSRIENIFGASTSIALILLFIFYSSLILYYGASFTYEYAASIGSPVLPGRFSERYEWKVTEGES